MPVSKHCYLINLYSGFQIFIALKFFIILGTYVQRFQQGYRPYDEIITIAENICSVDSFEFG